MTVFTGQKVVVAFQTEMTSPTATAAAASSWSAASDNSAASSAADDDAAAVDSDMDVHCELYDFIVCSVVIGTVCVFGLAGNTASFLVLHRHKQQTAAIFLLKTMAVSDFLLLVITLVIYTFPSFEPYSGRAQTVFAWFTHSRIYVWPLAMMLHTFTVWLTVLVTVNRYNAVCRAVEEFGNKKTLSATKVSLLVLVLLSILYNTPRFFEHQVRT